MIVNNQLYIVSGNKSYYNKMSDSTIVSEQKHKDVSEAQVLALSKEQFYNINVMLYPKHRSHFLINAMQLRLKPPSQKSMKRSQKRMKKKTAQKTGQFLPNITGKKINWEGLKKGLVLPKQVLLKMMVNNQIIPEAIPNAEEIQQYHLGHFATPQHTNYMIPFINTNKGPIGSLEAQNPMGYPKPGYWGMPSLIPIGSAAPLPPNLPYPNPNINYPMPLPPNLPYPNPNINYPMPLPPNLPYPNPNINYPMPLPPNLPYPNPNINYPMSLPPNLPYPNQNINYPMPLPNMSTIPSMYGGMSIGPPFSLSHININHPINVNAAPGIPQINLSYNHMPLIPPPMSGLNPSNSPQNLLNLGGITPLNYPNFGGINYPTLGLPPAFYTNLPIYNPMSPYQLGIPSIPSLIGSSYVPSSMQNLPNHMSNIKSPAFPGKLAVVKTKQQAVLKKTKKICQMQLEKWRQDLQVHCPGPKVTPLYFIKKKANQKRRRQQKKDLIKDYQKELYLIYGTAMFNSKWPVSREQIREKLGFTPSEPDFSVVGEFMEMVTE